MIYYRYKYGKPCHLEGGQGSITVWISGIYAMSPTTTISTRTKNGKPGRITPKNNNDLQVN